VIVVIICPVILQTVINFRILSIEGHGGLLKNHEVIEIIDNYNMSPQNE